MTNEQSQVKQWMQRFGQDTPEKPTIPSFEVRKLRAKLILEEALETINKGLSIGVEFEHEEKTILLNDVEEFSFCSYGHPDIVEIADGCEDLKVVTEGTLVACGLISNPFNSGTHPSRLQDPLFNEVMRSNFSKLWTTEEVNNLTKGKKMIEHLPMPFGVPYTEELTHHEYHIEGYRIIEAPEGKWLVKDKDGKVIKSPSYSKPELERIICLMSDK